MNVNDFIANNSIDDLTDCIIDEVIDQNLIGNYNGNEYFTTDSVTCVFTDNNGVDWEIVAKIEMGEKPEITEVCCLSV